MKKSFRYLLLYVTSVFIVFSAFADPGFFNVRTYGAKGDSIAFDTKAINDAIDAAATAGGGTVYFPAGNYLCGSIHLKSNICLYIDQGATIIAAEYVKAAGYDNPEKIVTNEYEDFGHRHWHNSLIWGENVHDVSIIGQGTIWGRGLERTNHIDKMKGEEDMNPNKSIALYKCRNIIIRDVSILHGGWFCLLATAADNLTVDNVKMDTNRDGMDIDCCQNVRISNCSVNSPNDDGICLKSSYGLNTGRATENVTITNCQVSGFDEGSFLDGTYKRGASGQAKDPVGRIKFGTESNGGYKNIAISNCVFVYCRGLALETVDGAILEDVTISNITMKDIVNAPIFIRLGARMRGPEGTPVGVLRRVLISDINIYNADSRFSSLICGIPGHDIEDLKLNNIQIFYRPLEAVSLAKIQPAVPEYEKEYPEPERFGVMPSYGFFIRHAKNLEMNNISVSFLEKETRPAFILDDVKGVDLYNIKAQRAGTAPLFSLKDVAGFSIRESRGVKNKAFEQKTTTTL